MTFKEFINGPGKSISENINQACVLMPVESEDFYRNTIEKALKNKNIAYIFLFSYFPCLC